MSRPIDPLDADVAAVVSAAEALDTLPPGAQARVLASVAARVAAFPPGGGSGGGAGGAGQTASTPAPTIASVGAKSAIIALVSFCAGVTVGVVAKPAPPPVERLVYVDRPAPPASAPVAAAWPTVPVDSLPVAASAQPAGTAETPNASAIAASSRDQLAAESALLDIARVAVAQGDGVRALEAVARHRTQFPGGALTEEREALEIKALHLLGRDAEARAHEARFERVYPKSLFLPALRGIVDPAP
jgi:hypothetical protein